LTAALQGDGVKELLQLLVDAEKENHRPLAALRGHYEFLEIFCWELE